MTAPSNKSSPDKNTSASSSSVKNDSVKAEMTEETTANKPSSPAAVAGKSKAKASSKKRSSPPKKSPSSGDPESKPAAAKKRRRAPAKKTTSNSPTKADNASNKPTKTSTSTHTPPPTHTLIIDNGGETLKYGWLQQQDANQSAVVMPRHMANVTARLRHQLTVLVGDELQTVQNPNQMHSITRSTERGMIVNLGNQVQVWKRVLDVLGVVVPTTSEAAQAFGWQQKARKAAKTTTTTTTTQTQGQAATILPATVAVLLLLPPHCPRILLDQIMYVWMEDFGVSHVGFATSAVCATQPHSDFETACVVDLGWSATNIVPTFRGKPIMAPNDSSKRQQQQQSNNSGSSENNNNNNNNTSKPSSSSSSCVVRRVPLGGRHMVNMWKYYTSYRQWNLMDQEWIMRSVFENLAYVSLDFDTEMEVGRNVRQGLRPFDRNFVLPDYQTTFQGHVEIPAPLKRQQEQQQQQQAAENAAAATAAVEAQAEESEEEDDDFDNNKPEEDEDEEDEDNENIGEEDGDNNDAMELDEEDEKKGTKKRKRKKKKDKKGKRKRKAPKDEDDNDEEDDDEEDDEDDREALRQRLLRQKHEDETRRREQEAEQQVLNVSVERFAVPEVLFCPSDAGLPLEMAGLPQAIVQSIEACPRHFQPALFRSIRLTGGLSQLSNLLERLQRELRALAPGKYDVEITKAEAPLDQAWLGAREWVQKAAYTDWSVSRDEWESSQKRKAWMRLLASNGGFLI